ncbi:hypothetical protein [Microbacterium trichothecenolyticum]|uniref:Uncharacterized protein n=1 Tax=Microbacterium trichothecenolyticum TaxID=69370 RepID=A0ABU0TUC0_MICTR|nr:hypothetical protein [Microbacterium trichothecenolyticum]MDQ1123258.1 hypothetical protein [Microbacterium trichothecenolyticum]
MTTTNTAPPGYWHGDCVDEGRGVRVVEAMRGHSRDETPIHRRMPSPMTMVHLEEVTA